MEHSKVNEYSNIVLGFSPENESEEVFVVCAYAPNISLEYPGFWQTVQ